MKLYPRINRVSRSVTESTKPPVLKFLLFLFCADLGCAIVAQPLFLLRIWQVGGQMLRLVAIGIEMLFLAAHCIVIVLVGRSRLEGEKSFTVTFTLWCLHCFRISRISVKGIPNLNPRSQVFKTYSESRSQIFNINPKFRDFRNQSHIPIRNTGNPGKISQSPKI